MSPSQFRPAFALSIAVVIIGASSFLVAGGGAAVGAEEGGAAGATPTPVVKANDDFVDAVLIPDPLPFNNKQSTTGATLETAEPNDTRFCLGDNSATIGATVWYQYTPSANAVIEASTFGSNFDTVLALYTGSTLASLVLQGCSVGNPGASLGFRVSAGTTYHFQLGGSDSQSGGLQFSLTPLGSPVPPTPILPPTQTPLPTPCPAQGCPSMSLRVSGTSAGSPRSCDSNSDAKCTLEPGSAFTVEIVPDRIPAVGYSFWHTLLVYGDLGYQPRLADDEITWNLEFQQFQAPDPAAGPSGAVAHADISAFFKPRPRSEQTTTLVTLRFNCGVSDTLRLVDVNERPDGTLFGGVDTIDVIVPEVGVMEVNCVEAPAPVGGIALEPDLGAPALEVPDDSSSRNTRAWAIVVGALAAAAIAALLSLTRGAWYPQRRR